MPHTEELALIICTLQIYNTTIHTSVGAETQEGRSLRGLAGWPAACSPGCQPLPICKTRVSFPSPSSLTLSFFLSFFLPISAPLFASSAIPPFHLLFFPPLLILHLLLCLPMEGRGEGAKIDAQNIALLPDVTICKFTKGMARAFFRIQKRETAFTG